MQSEVIKWVMIGACGASVMVRIVLGIFKMLGRLVEERWDKLLIRFMITLATLSYVPIATRSIECIAHIKS